MDLLKKLRVVADLWVELHGRTDDGVSLKTLGARALDNSKLFDREQMTVATFEKVVAFLAEPKSWPAAVIPDDASAILDSLVEAGRAQAA